MILILIILTDDEFLRFKKGDPDTIEKVYLECHKAIYNFLLLKSCGDKELVQEVLQETFLTAIKAAPGLRDPARTDAWLLRIACNKLTDYFRKKGREKKYLTGCTPTERGRGTRQQPVHLLPTRLIRELPVKFRKTGAGNTGRKITRACR